MSGPEDQLVREPTVERLLELGWSADQVQYDPEWRVPKTPSEATKREKGLSFKGFPVDIALFRDPKTDNDWQDVQVLFETKEPNERKGISQLEQYLSREPRAVVGIWTNGSKIKALFRTQIGDFVEKRLTAFPGPDDNLVLGGAKRLTWDDLREVSPTDLRKIFEQLLNHVVASDTKSTRRDNQLNQLCNLLLLKLESDRKGKVNSDKPVEFQVWGDEAQTADRLREFYAETRLTHRDVFSSASDETLLLDDDTIHRIAYELASLKLEETSPDSISIAFQVFRTASLKSEEGQYFTPYPVIRSGVKLMEVGYADRVIDPACGTGGFLIEAIRQFREANPKMEVGDIKNWAQQHIYGVDKDKINVKLTKAMMMILGDGSAHVQVGDSLRSNRWAERFTHLTTTLEDNSYTCVITNPPFGKDLTVSKKDARAAGLTIARDPKIKSNPDTEFSDTRYQEIPTGIAFIERGYRLLVPGGRLGIVLPETYMFSPTYRWLQSWLRGRLELKGMFNIAMEAFQGFCRAKTNFYIFKKV